MIRFAANPATVLEASSYPGFAGCEYDPAGRTVDGAAWFNSYRKR